jgi:hypothetical protein
MATILQHRRGNTAVAAAFTGQIGEIFIDTDTNQITIHDGVTVGGTTIPNINYMIAYNLAIG